MRKKNRFFYLVLSHSKSFTPFCEVCGFWHNFWSVVEDSFSSNIMYANVNYSLDDEHFRRRRKQENFELIIIFYESLFTSCSFVVVLAEKCHRRRNIKWRSILVTSVFPFRIYIPLERRNMRIIKNDI